MNIEETSISSKSRISISTQLDIEETSISKFKTSMSLYPDIEDFSISINAPWISIYDIEALCFDIECRVLRYRCFFAWAAVAPARSWTQIAVYSIYCASNVWRASVAYSLTPGPPQASSPSSRLEMTPDWRHGRPPPLKLPSRPTLAEPGDALAKPERQNHPSRSG